MIAQQLQDYSDLIGETEAVQLARFGEEIGQLLFCSPWTLGSKELHKRWKEAAGVDDDSLERKRSRKAPLKLSSSSSAFGDEGAGRDRIILGRYNDEGYDDGEGGYHGGGGGGEYGEWDGSGESPSRELSFERAPWDYAESSTHDFSVASVGLDLDLDLDLDDNDDGEFGGGGGGGVSGGMEVSVGSSLPIRSVSMEESVSHSQFEVKTVNFFK